MSSSGLQRADDDDENFKISLVGYRYSMHASVDVHV